MKAEGTQEMELWPNSKVVETQEPDLRQATLILERMSQVFSLALFHTGAKLAKPRKTNREVGAEAAAVGIVSIDEDPAIRSFREAAERIFDWQSADVRGRHVSALFDLDAETCAKLARRFGADGPASDASTVIRLEGKRRDAGKFAAEITRAEVEFQGQYLLVLVVRDIAGRERAESERREAETRFRSLVEQIPAVTFMGSLDDGLSELYVSPQIEGLLGFSQEEWLGDPFLWFAQLPPEDRERCNREFARGCASGGPFRADFRAFTRAGEVVWIHGEARVVRDDDGQPLCIQGVAYDITESKRAEQAMRAHAEHIKAALAEKEALLKEIHHRVKNNLQVISSLLRLQSGHLHDPAAVEMFKESCHRIQSMALVHEKLYQSANLSKVDFKEYVQSFTKLIFRSYRQKAGIVDLRTEIEDVPLSIDLAVPLGLIISELVSNCLKYAFPEGRGGAKLASRFGRPASAPTTY